MVIMPTKNSKKNRKEDCETEELNADNIEAEVAEKVPKEILIVAQEVQIVQNLACNDLVKRNKQLRKLRKWLQLRSRSSFSFGEEDFMRIWKGLYYNMWMSDKPLVQEDLAEQLGQLLECFDGDVEKSVNFFGAFLRTMCQEWFGIDQWRIDKFLMLTRRMLRYMFRVLRGAGWRIENIQCFNKYMQETVLAEESPAVGLTMHFLDIFFEELAKVSQGKIDAAHVGEFVRPFVWFFATQRDTKIVDQCRKSVFYHLLHQSTLGREYGEKYNAWREMGFPTTSINDLEKIEVDPLAEENGETVVEEEALQTQHQSLDPRAGNVDVYIPELPLEGKYIATELQTQLCKREMTTKRRQILKKLLALFERYQTGEFPLGVKTMPRYKSKSTKPLMKDKIEQLENMENEMYSVGRKLKQMNKRKRRKLLKSLNFEQTDENNYNEVIQKALPKRFFLERRKKLKGVMLTGWLEEKIDMNKNEQQNGDVVAKKKKNKVKQSVEFQKTNAMQRKGLKSKRLPEASEGEPAKKVPKSEQQATKSMPSLQQHTIDNNKQSEEKPTQINNKKSSHATEWNKPLEDGEIEYFIPSRKLQLKKANTNLVRNPLAKSTTSLSTPKTPKSSAITANSLHTPASVKRVKIALKHNTVQNPSEYIKQIKSSPNLPYDATRKPGKGLLKPNSMPSPINPFYKKKIGLKLLNDTF